MTLLLIRQQDIYEGLNRIMRFTLRDEEFNHFRADILQDSPYKDKWLKLRALFSESLKKEKNLWISDANLKMGTCLILPESPLKINILDQKGVLSK